MKAIERLRQYIDYKRINNSNFEKKIGLSNGYIGIQLKRNSDIGEGLLNKILDNCIDINPEWLLTGRGEMLRTPDSTDLSSINIVGGAVSATQVTAIGKHSVTQELVSAPTRSQPLLTKMQQLKQEMKELKIHNQELAYRGQALEKDKEHLLSQQKAYTEQIERQASQIERLISQIERQASQIERQASQIERLTESKG